MLVMAHATPLYRAYIEVRRTNFLQSVLSPPLSLFSASQRMRGAHRLFAPMRSRMSVKTQSGPTEPAHLSPRRAGDEKQIQERSSVAAFGVTQE